MLRLIAVFVVVAGCNPAPPSLATVIATEPHGNEVSMTLEGKTVWSGAGEQITVLLPGSAKLGEDQLSFPLYLGRVGSYQPDGSVIATLNGRSWQSRDDDVDARITIEKLVFLADTRAPWRHIGKLTVSEPDPVLHDNPLATLTAEFTVSGPDCKFAAAGESRCGVIFPETTATYDIVADGNNCPDYVNETWVVGAELSVTPASMRTPEGFEVIQCLDVGGGARLCGDSEDDLVVEDCVWSASIRLADTDRLELQGFATCGDAENQTTRTCAGTWLIR
jgi:hypothetical protein